MLNRTEAAGGSKHGGLGGRGYSVAKNETTGRDSIANLCVPLDWCTCRRVRVSPVTSGKVIGRNALGIREPLPRMSLGGGA